MIDHSKFKRFSLREDYCAITQHDIASAAALQVAEIKTSEIVDRFRREYQDGGLPPEEWRWFDITLHEMEVISLGMCRHSTYARTIADISPDRRRPSLIERGYLCRRYISHANELQPQGAAKIHRDIRGEEYVIVNAQGEYEGNDGMTHYALKEGFTSILRQYLLNIDMINTAINALS